MIEIDGSYLEGGGQIIRTAVALSCITGKPFKAFNIRKNRPNPGLKSQHLIGIEVLRKIYNAQVKGLVLGSTEFEFVPGELIHQKDLEIDCGTAGSITLILQTLLPPLMHSRKGFILKISGGTCVKWAPTIMYFQEVFCKVLKEFGLGIGIKVLKHGFYPKGGGLVEIEIRPSVIKKINLTERKDEGSIKAISVASRDLQKARVAERLIEGAGLKINQKVDYVDSLSTGTALLLSYDFGNTAMGYDMIGEKGKKAEDIGRECLQMLKEQEESGACLDSFMGDQVLPFLAMCGGKVTVSRVTDHMKTNMWVIEKFLDVNFKIEEGKNTIISTA